ncbi:hypothetical protein [Litoribacillus peritrichatus]|uniref:Uncharacterized protein n=1 Tax=Litoribacillus peritrichatus TaxID=718191 RepID=A0ABP7MRF7_9GAMM
MSINNKTPMFLTSPFLEQPPPQAVLRPGAKLSKSKQLEHSVRNGIAIDNQLHNNSALMLF